MENGIFLNQRTGCFLVLTVFWLTVVIAMPARALGDNQSITLRGFGTLGVAHNAADGAGFIRDLNQPRGLDERGSGHVDSRLGLQLSATLNPDLEFTVQALSRYGFDGDYDPELSWGFVKYNPNEHIKLRVGRLGWDVFMLADSRDVGFSYLWVRPPVEYFGSMQFSKFNGADLVLKMGVDGGVLTGKLFAGRAVGEVSLGSSDYIDTAGSKLMGGHIDYLYRDWQFRLGATRVDLDLELKGDVGQLLDALKPFGQISDILDPNAGDAAYFLPLGIIYNSGPLNAQLMYAYVKTGQDIAPHFHNTYLSVGYRMGQWTPFAVLSHTDTRSTARFPRQPDFPLPVELFEGVAAANTPAQHTFSLGARYDFVPNMALKLQFDQVNVRRRGREYMLWRDVTPDWDGRARVFSATLDFVF